MKRYSSIVGIAVFSFLLLLLSSSVFAVGQEDKDLRKKYLRVKELFDNDLFVSAQKEIDEILVQYKDIDNLKKSELEAYRLFCSIKLDKPDIDGLVFEFEDKYPYAPEIARAKFFHSCYYFVKNDYSRSLEIMNSMERRYLPKDERIEFMFNRAYCNMRVGRNAEAVSGFEKLISLGYTPYRSAARYYLGYVYYILKDFDNAINLFETLVKDNRYSSLSKYYLVESHFMLKNYEYVVDNGKAIFENQSDEYKIKLARMLSEAYFALDNPREAKEYLELYSKSGANLSRKDNYYSGVVSYTLNSYYAAIEAFSKVASVEDSLGQNAYYHMGDCYLKIKNKHNAMEAFRSASLCDFDKTIKEDASFLYAKLAFDVNSDISQFNKYVKDFPSSAKSDEIYNYIATSYLRNKNFKSAINALNKIKILTPEMARNLQKAAFFRSMQLLEMGSYRSAITDFKISVRNGLYNQRLSLLAQFWMAEAYYRTDEFQKSLDINKTLIQNSLFCSSGEYPMALYNIGYAYFRLHSYEDAILWFEEYLKLSPSKMSMATEAKTRIADSYFMLKEYENASAVYAEVATKNYDANDIYAAYMGALAYGLLSDDAKKIEMLGDIITNKPDSPIYPKAMYELGRTYVQTGNNPKAIECFNILKRNESDSTYYSKSLLELGMIHSNMAQYNEALGYFSEIVEGMPLSEDAQSALAGIESIYQIQNKPEDYLAYLDRIGMSSVKTADEKEMMLFNSVEQIFLAENYQEALASLQSFISKYPEGAKTPQAYFYLGETLNKLGKPEQAADAYLNVMKMSEGSFAELSTLYYARICLNLEKYDKSIEAYETLSRIAKLENNKFEALVGCMRAYYKHDDFQNAAARAREVLASEKGAGDIKEEATYILAKSYLSTGNRTEALPLFQKLSKNSFSDEGAESAYILILDAYDEGNFEAVENLVYSFSDSKTTQTYWLAKSFIVLGDSFAEREEWEQALATFNSIKEGYTPEREHDDVLEQVDLRISKIPSPLAN